jgi:formate dehydrogenase subunit beta
MLTNWKIKTSGDPILAVQHLLYDLWPYTDVEGMLVLLEPANKSHPVPAFVEDPIDLLVANPFLPLVTANAARLVVKLESHHPSARMGAMLRPCELRSLIEIMHQGILNREHWLVIGVDCLGSFSEDDYDWRLRKAEGVHQLASRALRNARQGGIIPHRYRQACQMCALPEEQEADLWIGVLGLPVKEWILVTARDERLAERLHLNILTDGPAESGLLAERQRVITRLNGQRMSFQERAVGELDSRLPQNLEGWLVHLADCKPCRACLEVCPICGGELPVRQTDQVRWLVKCAGCGMCEEACPDNLPLTAIHTYLSQSMQHEMAGT